ncbi:MAG: hypothetical protein ACRDV4_10110, partial [Acidimicrobiales bacterium]
MTDDRYDPFDDPFVEERLDDRAGEYGSEGPSDDAEGLLNRLVDLVEHARAMPLSTSVLVQREEVMRLLQGVLERLPDEMRQARWLLKEREEFIESGRREADDLLEEVRAQAERMVQRT